MRLQPDPSAAPVTHVYLEDGSLERIDNLTLEQSRQVIVRLCSELESYRLKKDGGHEVRSRVRGAR